MGCAQKTGCVAQAESRRYDRNMDAAEWDKLKETKHFEDLVEFPCSFSIKAVCRAGGWIRQGLEEALVTVVPDPVPQFIDQRASKGGKYVSFTIRLEVDTADHLRSCYGALEGLQFVRFVL